MGHKWAGPDHKPSFAGFDGFVRSISARERDSNLRCQILSIFPKSQQTFIDDVYKKCHVIEKQVTHH